MTQLNDIFTLFLSLLIESLPFLLLGIVVSSWILVFVDERRLVSLLPHNPILAAFVGSLLGLLLPVCKYGNVPLTRRLLLKGVSVPLAISFLVAAPTINPIVLWLTWKAFPDRPEILILRLLFTWAIAIIIGCIFSTHTAKRSLLSIEDYPNLEPRSTLLQSGTFLLPKTNHQTVKSTGKLRYGYLNNLNGNKPFSGRFSLFFDNTVRELLELGAVLIVGCAIAAAIQFMLPHTAILDWQTAPALRILVMLFLATILSIGSTVDAFFVRTLTSTFTSGSLLAFLLFGSIIDIKGIALIFSVFSPKAVIYLLVLSWQLTFLLTLFIDFNLS
ncbi:MAG: permease [Moorea sp. SIO2B7]|nr:permease [Moorena sp. SIO2B7]